MGRGHGNRLKNRGHKNAMGFGGHGGALYPPRRQIRKMPDVVFTATKDASEKLKFWIDMSFGEFGGFAVTADPNDRFKITDFIILPQTASGGHADLDNMAIAKYTCKMVKSGLQPNQFSRIWFHTHGGSGYFGPHSSTDDDNTFVRAFGQCDWSVMLIFNDAYSVYMELQNNKAHNIGWEIGFEFWEKPLSKKHQGWADEFDDNVRHGARVCLKPKAIKVTKPKATTNPQGHTFGTDTAREGFTGRVLNGADALRRYLKNAGKIAALTQAEQDYEERLDREADAEALDIIAIREAELQGDMTYE